MDIRGTGPNPFSSQKPEQVQSSPNRELSYCNAFYLNFQGLMEDKLGEEDYNFHKHSFLITGSQMNL